MPQDRPISAPALMGILNVTPDSFSDGGQLPSVQDVLTRARQLVLDGAGVLDIGAESTRPGATQISDQHEIKRLMPALEALLAENLDVRISVDTRHVAVARQALKAGAHILNDVSGMANPALVQAACEYDAEYILMHTRGTPASMQQLTQYDGDVVDHVLIFLRRHIATARAMGLARDKLWIDPGLGFAKTNKHNIALMRRLKDLVALGYPTLIAPSRKAFLGDICGRPVHDRDRATAACVAVAAQAGVHMIRVHDVAACNDALAIGAACATPLGT